MPVACRHLHLVVLQRFPARIDSMPSTNAAPLQHRPQPRLLATWTVLVSSEADPGRHRASAAVWSAMARRAYSWYRGTWSRACVVAWAATGHRPLSCSFSVVAAPSLALRITVITWKLTLAAVLFSNKGVIDALFSVEEQTSADDDTRLMKVKL